MSVAEDYWRHYYMTSDGKLRKKKRDPIPKYLRRARSSFTSRSSNSSITSSEAPGTFRGWNRSAYFRFKANQGYINQLENEIFKSKTKEPPPDWAKSSEAEKGSFTVPRNIASALRPLPISLVKKRPQSERRAIDRDRSKHLDPLSQLQHSIHGKIVIVTPQLVVTRQSPTPEENSPSRSSSARVLNDDSEETSPKKANFSARAKSSKKSEKTRENSEAAYRTDSYDEANEDDYFNENVFFRAKSAVTSGLRRQRTSSPHPRRSAKRKGRSSERNSAAYGSRQTSALVSNNFSPQVSDDEDYEIVNTDYFVSAPESDIYNNTSSIMPSNPKNSVPPPKRPAASWGFGNDSGKLGHKQDDDGYDSSRENDKNKTTFKERKKSKGRTSSLDDLKNVGKGDKSNKTYRTNLDNYRAIKLGLFKNGDPWFEPVNFHFLPGKEITSLEKLFHTISPKMDLIHGVTHMFDAKGKKITSLEEIEDGGIYVCSSSKKFSPGNYGSYGDGFYSGVAQTTTTNGGKRSVSPPQLPFSRSNSVMKKEKKQSTSVPLSAASSDISWLNDSKKAVILNGGGVKSGGVPNSPDGKVIRVINADNQTIQEKVLLNLKTSQSFEEVLVDLGQVLKIRRARLMCTKDGTEVKGFNQLRGVHAKETTFLISAFRNKVTYEGDDLDDSFATTSSYSPREARRNSDPVVQSRTRVSKSSARIESRAQSDKGRTQPDPLDTEGGTEPIKVTIKSERKLFYPPSKGYKKIVARPKSKPILDWVYGCRGFDVNRNVWILKSGELVYFVSTIAVIYAPVKESQRYYRGHNEDILCMDARPEQDLVMSAQRSGKTQDSRAHIRLWNADSLETLIVIGLGEYESKIAAVALSSNESSPGEILIAAVDGGGDRNLSVWQWDEKTRRAPLLGKVTTKADEIRGLAFHPLDNHLVITYGKNHLAFWTRTKNGYFDKSDMAQNKRTVTCLDFLDSGDLVVGDDSGSIKSYSVSAEGEYFKSNEFEAHPKGVNAVVALNDGIIASGGDKDRKIIAWDSARSFGKRGEAKLPDGVGSVRSISKHAVNQKPGDSSVYFCTTRNCILEGVIFKKTFKLNVWGHSSKLEAIAPHPNEQSFVTAGYDRYVVKWKNRKVAWKVTTQSELISVAYHPSGSTIVAGSLDGNVIVLNGETGAHVTTVRVCTVPLNELKFSFSGDYLACAAHKGDVHIFSSSKDGSSYKKEFKVGISNAPLITMDWSRDTRYIAAVTADFNLIFGDLKTQKVEKNAEALKDQEWIDQTCTMGFNVAGTWNNVGYKNDPSSTTAISISNHRDLVAAGDAQGFLRLFKYPCTTTRAEFNDAKTASNAVVGLRFLHQDKYLISVGGSDSTLLQWKIA